MTRSTARAVTTSSGAATTTTRSTGASASTTAFFNRPLSAYDVEINDDGSADVTDLVGDGGTDHLTHIERLVFGNGDDVIDL